MTGGGNGIGREIAIRFACEGCNIAIADMDIQAAENTAKELNETKNTIIARAYHVTSFFLIIHYDIHLCKFT